MKLRVVVGAIVVALVSQAASAQTFPRHQDICDVNNVVSPIDLATAFLQNEKKWLDLYLHSVDRSELPQEPAWRRIFIDKNFCVKNRACLAPDPTSKDKIPPINTVAAEATLKDLRDAFAVALADNTRPGQSYSIRNPGIGVTYFRAGNKEQIRCLPNEPVVVKAAPALKIPLRVRANSDDLNIDGLDDGQKQAFKGVKPATLTYTRDGIASTKTTKLQATIGYPITLGGMGLPLPAGLSSWTGELVPYFSASQSITKVDGRAPTYADTNTVAVGALLNTDVTFDWLPGDHYFMAKPQYLQNTKDRSELASLRFIYQPWTYAIPAINKPFLLPGFMQDSWLQLLFDLRHTGGEYTRIGSDPKTASTHVSFERTGSRFGFSLQTSDKAGPHVVWNVTETVEYGWEGAYRHLNLFDSTLTYYFDSSSNFGLTLEYTNGRDQDTAERTQSFTVGLSAKF